MRWALLPVVLFAANGAAQEGKTTLQYRLTKGLVLNYQMSQDMETRITVSGRTNVVRLKQKMDVTWKINDVDAKGHAKVSYWFKRIRFDLDTFNKKFSYDTDSKEKIKGTVGALMAKLFKAMTEAEIRFTMAPDGKITEVQVPENFLRTLKEIGGPGKGIGGNFLSEEGIKKMISQGGMSFPSQPIARGDSWSNSISQKLPFAEMKTVNTYVFEGVGNKSGKRLAKITVSPEMQLTPDPNSPITMKLEKQDSKGEAYFDVARGRLVSFNNLQTMQVTAMSGGENLLMEVKTTVGLQLQQ